MEIPSPLISAENLGYTIRGKSLLSRITLDLAPGAWLGILGENGAGKTTLLDLVMGFKKPTSGKLTVLSHEPRQDVAADRKSIAYLSEKVDLPGDWSIGEFLAFNRFFYPTYDQGLETDLCKAFRVSKNNRVGNLSAGEIRRAQIVGALSYRPKLILIDEITAVLDIAGRRRLMAVLSEQNSAGATILFATNILEGLHGCLTDLLLLHRGETRPVDQARSALSASSESKFFDVVADALEAA